MTLSSAWYAGDHPRIRNFTPHEVVVLPWYVQDGDATLDPECDAIGRFPSEGVARACEQRRVLRLLPMPIGTTSDDPACPLNRCQMGVIEGLPAPQNGVYLIVSRVVAEAARGRADLIIPDEAVRDARGRIIGCRAFASVAIP
jgi:hypothetical protein